MTEYAVCTCARGGLRQTRVMDCPIHGWYTHPKPVRMASVDEMLAQEDPAAMGRMDGIPPTETPDELIVAPTRADFGIVVSHELPLREPYYTDMLEGRKEFEVRRERAGRRFEVGDVITFTRFGGGPDEFQRVVTYVLRDMAWYGLPEDVAVLGLRTLPS